MYDIQETGLSAPLNALFWFCSPTRARVALGGFGWPFHVCVQRLEVTAVVFVLSSGSARSCIAPFSLRFTCSQSMVSFQPRLQKLQYWSSLCRAALTAGASSYWLYVTIEEIARCRLSTLVSHRCSFPIGVSQISKNSNSSLQSALMRQFHTLPLTSFHL